MNFVEKTNIPVSYAHGESSYAIKLSKILNACECSKNLMIGIYIIEKDSFFYCNDNLKGTLGDKCDALIRGGWNFWYSLVDPKELESIKNQISNFFTLPYLRGLLTLRYHITGCYGKQILVKHEIMLHQVEKHFLAINYFFDVTEKEKIEHCFDVSNKAKYSRSTRAILSISPREKQVLRLISDGYSSKQIADMLYISNHTAISHRKNLIEKFQVKNTAHLVKRAHELMQL